MVAGVGDAAVAGAVEALVDVTAGTVHVCAGRAGGGADGATHVAGVVGGADGFAGASWMAAVIHERDDGIAVSPAELGHDDSRVDVVDVSVLGSSRTEDGGASVGADVGLAAGQPEVCRVHAVQGLDSRGNCSLFDGGQIAGILFTHTGKHPGFGSAVGVGAGPHLIRARHASRCRRASAEMDQVIEGEPNQVEGEEQQRPVAIGDGDDADFQRLE